MERRLAGVAASLVVVLHLLVLLLGAEASSVVVVQVKVRISGRDEATAHRRSGLRGGRGSGKGSDRRKRRSDGSPVRRPP